MSIYKVVDLFAGPGGLAEGFASLQVENGRPFEVALSVEKDVAAHKTLLLRNFLRLHPDGFPADYYDYLDRKISREDLARRHKSLWERAEAETPRLELGSIAAEQFLTTKLDQIRDEAHGNTVLIGGPPCQAYSLVGRARNAGIAGYVAKDDHRHFLYREYIRILSRLRPAAFVMENVKGMLSASVEGAAIIEMVLEDLRRAGGCSDSYVLVPLTGVSKSAANSGGREFVVRSEDYGVPQARHRVIILGIRADLAVGCDPKIRRPVLEAEARQTVNDAIKGLPPLRSGLSKGASNLPEAWREAAVEALGFAADACGEFGQPGTATYLMDAAARLRTSKALSPRESDELGKPVKGPLGEWYFDSRLRSLRNHEARGHMASDLARYAFVATFAKLNGRSPKASDFPPKLAPSHANWKSGKFADRFRAQRADTPSSTITSHISKDGHYFIHPDPMQCRSLTVREAARLQTFPDNYLFEGNRTQQYVQVGNAVPPLLAHRIATAVHRLLTAVDETAVSNELRNVA